jgi:hypothetical protein
MMLTPLKANNDYVRVNVIFTVSWNDSRLASDSVIDRDVPTSSIWIPDLRGNYIDSVIQIDQKLYLLAVNTFDRIFVYHFYDKRRQQASFSKFIKINVSSNYVPNVPNVPMALEHNCYCF